jgi:fructokinase
VVNGKTLHGLIHPEAGHMLLPHDRSLDPFEGICPYHGDCLEGLAAGPALAARWGKRAEELPADHPAWDLEATYIALAIANLIYSFSPKRVVIGGGVFTNPAMVTAVRNKVQQKLNGYLQSPQILNAIDDYIIPPTLGARAGVLGSLALGIRLVE